jgi:glycosyltransferase involved in cell wall biosynthesis
MLSAFDREAVAPRVLLPGGEASELGALLSERGIPVHGVEWAPQERPSAPWAWPGFLLNLRRATRSVHDLAKREEVDLIHANTWKAGFMATGLPLLTPPPPCPVLLPHRDLSIPAAVRGVLADRCATGLAVSDFLRTVAEGELAGLPLATLHSGVDLSRFEDLPSREEARDRLGLPREGRIILGAANRVPWKRRDLFLEVVAALHGEDESITGLLVGRDVHQIPPSPPFSKGGAATANSESSPFEKGGQRGISACRERTLSYWDMPLAYAAADLLLHPAENEPFGRVIVEALAAGLPIVTTEGGGPAEILSAVPKAPHALTPRGSVQGMTQAARSLLSQPPIRSHLDLSPFDTRSAVLEIQSIYLGIIGHPTNNPTFVHAIE